MAIIKQYNKKIDVTYVYESVSYYDPAKKQSRSHRRLLGKIDPSSGEVVPTGKRGRPKKAVSELGAGAQTGNDQNVRSGETGVSRQEQRQRETIDAQKAEIVALKTEVRRLSNVISRYEATFEAIGRLSAKRTVFEFEPSDATVEDSGDTI